jgi:hypothetical protein
VFRILALVSSPNNVTTTFVRPDWFVWITAASIARPIVTLRVAVPSDTHVMRSGTFASNHLPRDAALITIVAKEKYVWTIAGSTARRTVTRRGPVRPDMPARRTAAYVFDKESAAMMMTPRLPLRAP